MPHFHLFPNHEAKEKRGTEGDDWGKRKGKGKIRKIKMKRKKGIGRERKIEMDR